VVIIGTFKLVNEKFYAMVFEKGDPSKVNEFIRLYRLWTDTEYLTDFFEKNKDLLRGEYWSQKEKDKFGKPLSVREAVDRTVAAAKKFFTYIVKVAEGKIETKNLADIFRDLYDVKDELEKFDKAKAYSIEKPYWLRIYGIKINDELFVITGGGIKLVRKMSESNLLKIELEKLEAAAKYLENDKDIDGDLEELIDNS
jgi:hypothetical protein